jgi:general secretion pathway protein I
VNSRANSKALKHKHWRGFSVHGFSLLEAIVALAILTTAGLALFAWISASFDSLNRIEDNNRRAAAELNALEYLKTVNPMQTPTGNVTLGETSLRWQSRALDAPRPNVPDGEGAGPFLVALYEVDVTLEGATIGRHAFRVQQLGFVRTVDPDEDPFGATPTRPTGAGSVAGTPNRLNRPNR